MPAASRFLYHVYDYQFFFRNLQENVHLRTDRFLADNAGRK